MIQPCDLVIVTDPWRGDLSEDTGALNSILDGRNEIGTAAAAEERVEDGETAALEKRMK